MPDPIYTDITRRHDFIFLIDVLDGNPNGDPDAGNLPRVDPETMQGLITDVCLKRKVRNFVDLLHGTEYRYKIYVQNQGFTLNELHQRAYTATRIKSTGSKQPREEVVKVRRWMCDNFYDIRTFGAVMSTRINCGQVRGPVQLTFARSIDPVFPLDLAITRVAVTNSKKPVAEEERSNEGGAPGYGEMGRKAILPYGLYRGYGFINPMLARDTGFSREDLALFWRAMLEMWDCDRSAGRGMMACRGLYVFTHACGVGNAPADRLFPLLEIRRSGRVAVARGCEDYEVKISNERLPAGVHLTSMISAWGHAEGLREDPMAGTNCGEQLAI
jgi:CRISPR-associated protein Csd2